jgi:DNA-binding NarL/FixJ family response regulator
MGAGLLLSKRLRVLVVDDHEVVTWGLRAQLTRHPWVERCLQATDGANAIAIAERYSPHVAVIDLALGRESGADLCQQVRRAVPSTQVLLMSSGESIRPRAVEVVGACGFVSKQWTVDEIIAAIRMVGLGLQFGVRTTDRPTPHSDRKLTPREADVVRLMARGATNGEIAGELALSLHTVKQHAHAAYRKLDARNRTDAVQRAQRLGLLG